MTVNENFRNQWKILHFNILFLNQSIIKYRLFCTQAEYSEFKKFFMVDAVSICHFFFLVYKTNFLFTPNRRSNNNNSNKNALKPKIM